MQFWECPAPVVGFWKAESHRLNEAELEKWLSQYFLPNNTVWESVALEREKAEK